MGNITWHKGGIYSKTLKRRINGKPLEVFYGQVWIPSEKKLRHFRLGTTPRQAGREMRRILGNPEAALKERQQRRCGTFSLLLDRFLANYHSRGDTNYYQQITKPLSEHFGKRIVSSITPAAIDEYLAWRRDLRKRGRDERRVGESSLGKEVTALGTVLRWARRRGFTDVDPLADYDKPKSPMRKDARDIVILEPAQEEALKKVTPGWFWNIIEWAIYSGMRRGEIVVLRYSDIDRRAGLIQTSSKTGKKRTIPMHRISNRLQAILKRIPRHAHSDYVFCDQEGRPFDAHTMNSILESVERRASISSERGVMWNRYRHTFGTRLAAAGVSMFEVSKWMGNSVAVCEKHYAAYRPPTSGAGLGVLDNPVTGTTDHTADWIGS
ncbi:MAG: site-specific integrase [Acidobacteria bacterium]|nr:site-specific integrase [Acidobacteriota bacterium]